MSLGGHDAFHHIIGSTAADVQATHTSEGESRISLAAKWHLEEELDKVELILLVATIVYTHKKLFKKSSTSGKSIST